MNSNDFDNNYLQPEDDLYQEELDNIWNEFEYEDFDDEDNDAGIWYGDY